MAGQSLTFCLFVLSLLVCTSAASGRWTSANNTFYKQTAEHIQRGYFHLLVSLLVACLVCITSHPVGPVGGNGKQAVSGHNRVPPMRLFCSLLSTPMCRWQCPTVAPPSCGRSCPLPPGIQVSRPAGGFPQPHHSPGQISMVCHGALVFLSHRHRTQMNLQGDREVSVCII